MKKLGITQRVEVRRQVNERRDCLDQKWYELAKSWGFSPIPLPNLRVGEGAVHRYLESLSLDAIILSGGNSLEALAPMAHDRAPERDAFEIAVINFCISRERPLLGVCRGMQIINHHFGGQLTPVTEHVGTRHQLLVDPEHASVITRDVNSFHNWGIAPNQLGDTLQSIATDEQGYIEAFRHQRHRIAGIMWHPERETPFRPKDAALIDRLLK